MIERRRGVRVSARTHGLERGRLRPGHAADIRDICDAGVAFETTYRVLPGRIVDVLVIHAVHRHAMRGVVVRCAVCRVTASRLCYVAAVAFEQPQLWIAQLHLMLPPLPAEP